MQENSLELVDLTSIIDSEVNVNRYGNSADSRQFEANDAAALDHWLAIFSQRRIQTHRSYATEARRFHLFLSTIHSARSPWQKQWLLRDATEQDVLDYEAVLSGSAVNLNGRPVPVVYVPKAIFEGNGLAVPIKQPFGRIHKRSSVNQALSILHAMYEHWRLPMFDGKQPYIIANPVSRIKKSVSRGKAQSSRSIPIEAIAAMRKCIDKSISMAGENNLLAAKFERQRWMLALFYGLWGRRQEIASLRMGDFVRDFDGWKVTLIRKGQKEQVIPVGQWVVDALVRYRKSIGLQDFPQAGESWAAIQRLRGDLQAKTITAEAVYQEIKAIAFATADDIELGQLLQDETPERRAMFVDRLREFSPHWFRHSGATIGINSGAISIENASKLLGHSNTAVTSSMYHHGDDSQIRKGVEQMGSAAFGN